ncbi:hypothetical protein SISSUDRAFT_256864 [Sistotremastrum suecicum HHB10207 ss-3]|uniref:SWR1-complex protein 5 n=1 Tax=Sistotremastrum suecicum HHB10207 ss-3 TaxID=1314776 RepID=A0A166GCP3_9AGAM|nr:hypothetical protein SISSUDRAFT_256864 [Sistotremastrum suecicum HHB10207 ss-3]
MSTNLKEEPQPVDIVPKREDEDSDEDDSDYVPEGADGSANDDSDSDSADEGGSGPPSPKRVKADLADLSEEKREAREKERAALWEAFQASTGTTLNATPDFEPPSMIKVRKSYRFAGKDFSEVVMVAEGSTDAQQWPRVIEDEDIKENIKEETPALPTPESIPSTSAPLPTLAPPSSTPTPSSTSAPSAAAVAVAKPGPRKPKTVLGAIPNTKPKKLTTLDKSAMDWKAHVNEDEGTKDELEANRRGGGYLEKVEFLERVEERKEAGREAAGSKRRRN